MAAKGDEAEDEAARRKDRLSSALRENLKRRKAQARGRASPEAAEAPEAAPDTSGPLAPAPAREDPGKRRR